IALGEGPMTDFETMRIAGLSFDEFSRSLTEVIQALPPEMRKRLHDIRRNYFAWYGFEGAYQRMNDRTVSQIFAEYQPMNVTPVASGEVDGVRYELHEAPPPRSEGGERTAEE